MRTATAKFFREPDGRRTAEIHARPIHFKTTSGSWADIDPTVVSSPHSRFAWRNRQGPVQMAFARAARESDLVRVRKGSAALSFGLAGASSRSTGHVRDNRVTYRDVFRDVDLVFDVRDTDLKETLVLRRPPRGPVSFRFPLSLRNLVVREGRNGEISLVRTNGRRAFRIPYGRAGTKRPREAEPRVLERTAGARRHSQHAVAQGSRPRLPGRSRSVGNVGTHDRYVHIRDGQ
jgi:hypothetical protein